MSSSTQEDLLDRHAAITRKIEVLRGNKKAYLETSQTTVKANDEVITALKTDNKELKDTIAQIDCATLNKPDPVRILRQEVERIQTDVNKMRVHLDTLQHQEKRQRNSIQLLNDDIGDLKKETQSPEKDSSTEANRVRLMETRIDEIGIKYSEAVTIMRTYEQIIEHLKAEQNTFQHSIDVEEARSKGLLHDCNELKSVYHDGKAAADLAQAETDAFKKHLEEMSSKYEKVLNDKRDEAQRLYDEAQRQQAIFEQRQREAEEAARIVQDTEGEGEDTTADTNDFESTEDIQSQQVQGDQGRIDGYENEFSDETTPTAVTKDSVAPHPQTYADTANIYRSAYNRLTEALGVTTQAEIMSKITQGKEVGERLTKVVEASRRRVADLEDEIVKARALVLDANFKGTTSDGNSSAGNEEKSETEQKQMEAGDKEREDNKDEAEREKRKSLPVLQTNLQQARADLSRLQEKHEKTEALMVNILGGIVHVTSELLPISGVRTADGDKCEKDYKQVDVHNAHITDAEDMLKACFDKLTNIGNIVGLPTEADINDEQLSETDTGFDGKLRSPTSPIVSVQNIPAVPTSSSAGRVSQTPGGMGRTKPGSVGGMSIQSGISGVGSVNPIVDRATMKRRAEEISRKRKEKEMEEKEKAGLL